MRAKIAALIGRVQASPLASRLARGAAWTLVATIVSRLLTVPATIVVARLLGREGFGEYGMVQNAVALYAAFAGLGTGPTATKYVAELRDADPARAGRILALCALVTWVVAALVCAVLFVLAPTMARDSLKAPELTSSLRIAIVLVFFGATNGAQGGALAGLEAFRLVAKVTAVTGIVTFPLTALGAWFYGLNGALVGAGLVSAVTWLVYHVALRSEAKRFRIELVFRGCLGELPVLWRFGLPALLGGLMVAPVNYYSTVLLAQLPDGRAENGILAAAGQWRQFICFFPAAFATVLLPVLANLQGVRDRTQHRKAVRSALLVTGVSAGGAALALIAVPGWIMSLYDPSYRSGAWALVLMALTAVAMSFGNVFGQIIASSGRMWLGLAVNAIWAVSYLVGMRAFVHHGAVGVALANFVAYALLVLTSGAAAWRAVAERDAGAEPAPSA